MVSWAFRTVSLFLQAYDHFKVTFRAPVCIVVLDGRCGAAGIASTLHSR